MAPLTPMTPAAGGGAVASSAGRFADRWQKRAGGGAGGGQAAAAFRPLTEADKKMERQLNAKRKYALSTALERGRIEEALEAAEDLQLYGQAIPHDLLYRLICTAADTPGVERFAKVVNVCTKADITFDIMEWASLVGKLMARDAPHAQVRVALNFGVHKDAKVMELVPVEANRQTDVEKVFCGAEHLDIGELSDEEDLATILHGRAASGLRAPPKALSFGGCTFKKLNGTYFKCKRTTWEASLSRKPVYKKMEGAADRNPVYAYYYEPEFGAAPKAGDAEEWKAGWYIGTEVGGGGNTYAYCDEAKSELPPMFANWHIYGGKKGESEELLGFERVSQVKGSDSKILEWEEAQKSLSEINLDLLPGRVVDSDPDATKYFCHFFILLHLEQLAEVAGFRGRFGFRSAKELASFGIALIDTEYDSKWGFTEEGRRMPLPGWPDVGAEKVAFKLPRELDLEKFSIKRGESCLISRGDPLKSRIAEGSVTDVDFNTRLIVVNINGKFPDFDFKAARFRLDCYANRTTFERQLTALLQFVTMKRTKMQEMLIVAGVGKVDLAVLGGDGFADPSVSTKLAEEKKKKEQGSTAQDTPGIKADDPDQPEDLEELLEMPDDGKDFGEDGTWVDVAVAEDEEEVEVDESEDEAKPRPRLSAKNDDLPPPIDSVFGDGLPGTMPSGDSPGDDLAKRLAMELAGQFEADSAAPAADAPLPELKDTGGQLLAKLLSGDATAFEEIEQKPDMKAELGEPLTEEERAKQVTLSLASEDAEGIDMGRLAEAKEMVQTLPDLSTAQRSAITNALSKRLTIVQGPPGTGKTHTSVRILTMWAKQMRYTPLLATSECNIAVDNIAEGLAKAGVKVCRIGRPEKVRDILEPVCLDNMVKADRANRQKNADEELGSDLEELGEEPWDEESWEHQEWEELRKKWRRKRAWDKKQDAFARARFVEQAEVLCSTTITAGSQALAGFKFHAILIDEVAQATEVSAIVPIICRGAKQIALCGDHCQLPPSTVSREAELRGMSLSLYSRLVEAGVPFQFLDTQYRAHPALMEFSASCIYQGKLKNGIDGSKRPVPKGIPWPNPDNPAAFFECGKEEGLNGESKDNPGEAEQVLNLIEEALKHGDITLNDIGVVTPYKGQVRTLRTKIFARFPAAQKSRELEIASVDNFQGREKELIVFSAVRCNKEAKVGFLNDWRRLNVMITRARRGLVVIGHAATLCCDKHWRMWMQFTEKQGGCPKGTVESAIREAKENLELSGKHKKARALFPEPTIDDILAGTPGLDPEAEAKRAKKGPYKAKTPKEAAEQAVEPGKDEDFEYLAEEEDWEEEGEDYVDVEVAPAAAKDGSKKRKQAAGDADWDWSEEAAWEEQAAKKKPIAKAKRAAVSAGAWGDDEWDSTAAKAKPKAKAKEPAVKAKAKAPAANAPAVKAKAKQPAAKAAEWDEAAWDEGVAKKAPAAKTKQAKAAEVEEWDDAAWLEWEEPEPAKKKMKPAAEQSQGAKGKEAQETQEMDSSVNAWGILGASPLKKK